MIQFPIKDRHIWAREGQNIAPASLPEEVRDWLIDSGITWYDVKWCRLDDLRGGTYLNPHDMFETRILFYKDKDALLFKLRWYEYIDGA